MLHMWDRSGYGFLVGKPERQNGLKGLGVERGQYRNESKRKTNGSDSGWGPIADSCINGNDSQFHQMHGIPWQAEEPLASKKDSATRT